MSQLGNYPITEKYKQSVNMNEQIKQLKRENQDLKDLLQDVHLMVIGKAKSDFGLTEQEIAAKVKSVAGGVKYNALDWDFRCKNGEQ